MTEHVRGETSEQPNSPSFGAQTIIRRRYAYLEELRRNPVKIFYIDALVPSVFTIDTTWLDDQREAAVLEETYQRAARLFVGYLSDIYGVLTGENDYLSQAKELSIINEGEKQRLLTEIRGLDEAVPEQNILDGTDILTGRDSVFFSILRTVENPVEYQRKVAIVGQELSRLSVKLLLRQTGK